MKSGNELKSRIKSIKETAQITKAMQLISVSKMKKAVAKYGADNSFNLLLKETIADMITSDKTLDNPYSKKREGSRIAYIVIASDKGLAGDYNHKVLDAAYKDMKTVREKFVFTIGHIAYEYFNRKGINVDIEYLHIIDDPKLRDARKIMYNILDLYDRNMMDEVRIVYTETAGSMASNAVVERLLPMKSREEFLNGIREESGETSHTEYELFGDKNKILNTVIELYLLGSIYSALVQSVICEHKQRMIAMDNATRNGKEMLEKLSIDYNKIRQEKITTEIIETSVSMLRKD